MGVRYLNNILHREVQIQHSVSTRQQGKHEEVHFQEKALKSAAHLARKSAALGVRLAGEPLVKLHWPTSHSSRSLQWLESLSRATCCCICFAEVQVVTWLVIVIVSHQKWSLRAESVALFQTHISVLCFYLL